jgi:hypothetical protein
MAFFKNISPTRAGGDLIAYLREDRPYKVPLFLAACFPPAIMIGLVYFDALEKAKPPPPEVMYFESWPLTRTIEESRAAIAKNGIEKTKQLEAAKEAYKALGRATGMDVDAIEREAIADSEKAKASDKALEASKTAPAGAAK